MQKKINKKISIGLMLAGISFLFMGNLFAQSFDDDLFGDDDLFFGEDDGIIQMEETSSSKPKTDLKNGVLFENGSVKIGGSFNTSLGIETSFIKDKDIKDCFKDTSLNPVADAAITIDARPTESLRMYMKTGIAYPFVTAKNASLFGGSFTLAPDVNISLLTSTDLSFRNLFYIKELFTDFNLGQNVSMRFGKQTVTWGVGYFFSPADVINAAIDPENPTAQVEGPLCLRAQIVFPGTQNALWAYIIPDNGFLYGSSVKAIDTALAAKGEFVIGGWELGIGGYYKYNTTPRLSFTASGTIFDKISVFGEAVGAYGQTDEWKNGKDKNFFFQGTAGFMYTWKDPKITLMGQYYYNGQNNYEIDTLQTALKNNPATTSQAPALDYLKRSGHNAALAVNFNKVGTNDLSAAIYVIANFTQETTIASAMMTYSPFTVFKISFGPYLMWNKYTEAPVVSAKINFTLGGGKF